MKTLVELKKHSKQVFLKRVTVLNCVEDIPAMEKELKNQLKAQGYDFSDWDNDYDSWGFGTQFITKPKLKRETSGLVTFRSGGDYTFSEGMNNKPVSYGPKLKKENLREYGFAIQCGAGEIQYYLVK